MSDRRPAAASALYIIGALRVFARTQTRARPTERQRLTGDNSAIAPIAGVQSGAHMVDGEVIRLRQLRERALKTRALATAMDMGELSHNTALARSAHSCWRIAKVVTGALRGHPNLICQRDYSPVRAAYDRLNARFMAMIARRRDTSAQVFCEALWGVARELDDACALTWSAELGETLGRAQLQLRQLLREFEAATLHEAHAHRVTLAPLKSRTASRTASRLARSLSRTASRPAMDRDELNAKPAPWPYLAL